MDVLKLEKDCQSHQSSESETRNSYRVGHEANGQPWIAHLAALHCSYSIHNSAVAPIRQNRPNEGHRTKTRR